MPHCALDGAGPVRRQRGLRVLCSAGAVLTVNAYGVSNRHSHGRSGAWSWKWPWKLPPRVDAHEPQFAQPMNGTSRGKARIIRNAAIQAFNPFLASGNYIHTVNGPAIQNKTKVPDNFVITNRALAGKGAQWPPYH